MILSRVVSASCTSAATSGRWAASARTPISRLWSIRSDRLASARRPRRGSASVIAKAAISSVSVRRQRRASSTRSASTVSKWW
jgi:hypothetical protein